MGAIAAAMIGTLGIGFAATTAFADPGGMGPGMMHGPMAGGMQQHDAAFAANMGPVHEMLLSHDRLRRTVTNLQPDPSRPVRQQGQDHHGDRSDRQGLHRHADFR